MSNAQNKEQANPLFAFTEEELAYLQEGYDASSAALSPYATHHEDAIYEDAAGNQAGEATGQDPYERLVRPAFVSDVDRILNNAFYNRCMDKTQVFPFYRNDDLTRRSFHLQLVSQISRRISTALRLNVALTEAIALGHDMGHTPFGHGGERILSDLYFAHKGRYFNHNVHSVRLLRTVAGRNLSLQTLNGMLCHCGEKAFLEYRPARCESFEALDEMMELCYTTAGASQNLRPSTLEGCVVRISDILAYLGKDRQDALSVGVLDSESYPVKDNVLGATNREFVQNATANIVKNSIGRDYLAMDQEVFDALIAIRNLNTQQIYLSAEAQRTLDEFIQPMMERVYEQCLADVVEGNERSYIFRHHINAWFMKGNEAYRNEEPNAIVVDYLASMTDDYFIDLFNTLNPNDAVPAEKLFVPIFH